MYIFYHWVFRAASVCFYSFSRWNNSSYIGVLIERDPCCRVLLWMNLKINCCDNLATKSRISMLKNKVVKSKARPRHTEKNRSFFIDVCNFCLLHQNSTQTHSTVIWLSCPAESSWDSYLHFHKFISSTYTHCSFSWHDMTLWMSCWPSRCVDPRP